MNTMFEKDRLNHNLTLELYDTNKVFVENHENCREKLFESYHKFRGDNECPKVDVWLTALKEVEKYFVLNKDEKKMFYIVAEHFYSQVELELKEYPLSSSPQFYCQCERFVCWFDSYLNREQKIE